MSILHDWTFYVAYYALYLQLQTVISIYGDTAVHLNDLNMLSTPDTKLKSLSVLVFPVWALPHRMHLICPAALCCFCLLLYAILMPLALRVFNAVCLSPLTWCVMCLSAVVNQVITVGLQDVAFCCCCWFQCCPLLGLEMCKYLASC